MTIQDTAFRIKNGLVVNNQLFIVDPSTNRVGVNTSSMVVTFEVNATDAIKVPIGNTTQRPSGANGHLRFNTDIQGFEGFQNGSWGSIGGSVTVGGSNTQIQFNDSTLLGGVSGFTFNKTTNTLSVGTSSINSTAFTLPSITGTAFGVIVSSAWTINATVATIGNSTVNTTVSSGSIQLNGATINSTFFTGASNTANVATTALTANNSTNLNSQAASFYLDCGNATGTLNAARLGTTGSAQFGTVGVGVSPPGSSALYVSGTIYSYTQVATAGNVISNSSDRRLKKNVQKIKQALVKVRQLQGITYDWNELAHEIGLKDTSRQVGLFADDVERVQPEIVPLSPADSDIDGNSISGENYKTVMYERLVPLLVEAIKEIADRLEELEDEIL